MLEHEQGPLVGGCFANLWDVEKASVADGES
jgi:hypothetical protein